LFNLYLLSLTDLKKCVKDNRYKLNKPNIRELKNVIDPEIYEVLLQDCFDEFVSLHKSFATMSNEMLLSFEDNYQVISKDNG
jgi:hypothetical protein